MFHHIEIDMHLERFLEYLLISKVPREFRNEAKSTSFEKFVL